MFKSTLFSWIHMASCHIESYLFWQVYYFLFKFWLYKHQDMWSKQNMVVFKRNTKALSLLDLLKKITIKETMMLPWAYETLVTFDFALKCVKKVLNVFDRAILLTFISVVTYVKFWQQLRSDKQKKFQCPQHCQSVSKKLLINTLKITGSVQFQSRYYLRFNNIHL